MPPLPFTSLRWLGMYTRLSDTCLKMKERSCNSLIGKQWPHRASRTTFSIQNPKTSYVTLSQREDCAFPSRASVPSPVRASPLPPGHEEPAPCAHARAAPQAQRRRHARSGCGASSVSGRLPGRLAQTNPGGGSASRLRLFRSQSAASMQIARRHLPAGRGGAPCCALRARGRAWEGPVGWPRPPEPYPGDRASVSGIRETAASCACRGPPARSQRRRRWEFSSDCPVFSMHNKHLVT